MKDFIMEIMKENFDSDALRDEITEIITDTMSELYHDLAHQILEDYDPETLLYEVATEYFDIPF